MGHKPSSAKATPTPRERILLLRFLALWKTHFSGGEFEKAGPIGLDVAVAASCSAVWLWAAKVLLAFAMAFAREIGPLPAKGFWAIADWAGAVGLMPLVVLAPLLAFIAGVVSAVRAVGLPFDRPETADELRALASSARLASQLEDELPCAPRVGRKRL